MEGVEAEIPVKMRQKEKDKRYIETMRERQRDKEVHTCYILLCLVSEREPRYRGGGGGRDPCQDEWPPPRVRLRQQLHPQQRALARHQRRSVGGPGTCLPPPPA